MFSALASDAMRDTTKEFQKKLDRGEVKAEDFERYIYGQHGSRTKYRDERDAMEEKEHLENKRIERAALERIK